MNIKVKYHTDIEPLQQIDIGDAIDVRAAEDVDLKMFEYAQIPLGFSCQLPDGYFAILSPRSSTYKKYGIIMVNSIGVIDSSYCSDSDQWAMPVISLKADIHIPKGERIGQFFILPKMPNVEFETVATLGNKARGGFGSTDTQAF